MKLPWTPLKPRKGKQVQKPVMPSPPQTCLLMRTILILMNEKESPTHMWILPFVKHAKKLFFTLLKEGVHMWSFPRSETLCLLGYMKQKKKGSINIMNSLIWCKNSRVHLAHYMPWFGTVQWAELSTSNNIILSYYQFSVRKCKNYAGHM